MKNLLFTGNPATGKTFLPEPLRIICVMKNQILIASNQKISITIWIKSRISLTVIDVSLFKFIRA